MRRVRLDKPQGTVEIVASLHEGSTALLLQVIKYALGFERRKGSET